MNWKGVVTLVVLMKHRLIIEKNLKKKLETAGFDIKKLWSKAPSGLFKDVPNDSDKIKIV